MRKKVFILTFCFKYRYISIYEIVIVRNSTRLHLPNLTKFKSHLNKELCRHYLKISSLGEFNRKHIFKNLINLIGFLAKISRDKYRTFWISDHWAIKIEFSLISGFMDTQPGFLYALHWLCKICRRWTFWIVARKRIWRLDPAISINSWIRCGKIWMSDFNFTKTEPDIYPKRCWYVFQLFDKRECS